MDKLQDIILTPADVLRYDLHHHEVQKELFHEQNERTRTKVLNIIRSVFVRCFYLGEIGFFMYYMIDLQKSFYHMFFLIGAALIVIDGVIIAIWRHGKEYAWWSPCTFIYSLCMIIQIWILTLIKYNKENHECPTPDEIKEGKVKYNFNFAFLNRFSECEVLEVLVAVFMISLMIGRWTLPLKKRLSNEFLAQMLLEFVANGSDITEFFAFVDEKAITIDLGLTNVILFFFAASTLKFSLMFGMRRRKRNNLYDINNIYLHYIFGTEIWVATIMFLLQDFPFLIIRLIVLGVYQLKRSYSLYYFIAKNVILCIAEIYRIIVVIVETRRKKSYLKPPKLDWE